MSPKRDATPSHDKPVDDNDMKPSLGVDMPESDHIDEEAEPFGDNFV